MEATKEKMTLNRALRWKKRVIETIRKYENNVRTGNSIISGNEREVDVVQSYENRTLWVTHLKALKLTIQDATRPIMSLILELAEIKAEITFVNGVSTQHGKCTTGYSDTEQVFDARLRKSWVDAKVADLQRRADELQTLIDEFNGKTQIEILVPAGEIHQV